MLPVENAKGEILAGKQFLCMVEYEISAPILALHTPDVQRIVLEVPNEDCAALLDSYDLILVLADGRPYHIPRPILSLGTTRLECYVET
jgi:hypothetical protein